jgi:hypothetical protein
MTWIKKNSKLIIFILIIAVIMVLNHKFGWSAYLSNSENLKFLSSMIHEHFIMAALIYIGLTIIACVVLALPGVTFAILAGAIFGPWWGTLFCLIATTLGAIIAFIVGTGTILPTGNPDNDDIYVADINGKIYTDKEFVVAHMQHTMSMIASTTKENNIEEQLGAMFSIAYK